MVAWKDSTIKLKEMKFPNTEEFEIVAAVGKIAESSRQLAVLAAYIPPGYRVPRAKACLEKIANLIHQIKNDLADPLIIIGGDFNQWDLEGALADFPDLWDLSAEPTRGNRRIDLIFTNLPKSTTEGKILPPLETDDNIAAVSDHNILLASSELSRGNKKKVDKYTYRVYTPKSEAAFLDWIRGYDWTPVLSALTSQDKAVQYQNIIEWAMDNFFPRRTGRRREGEDPWFNEVARKKTRKKRIVYQEEGRSPRWWALRADLDKYLDQKRQQFLENQRCKVFSPDASKNFYKNVRSYSSAEKPKEFDLRQLKPELNDQEMADNLAHFFHRISDEFDPLAPDEIPTSYGRVLPKLTPHQVAEKHEAVGLPLQRQADCRCPC